MFWQKKKKKEKKRKSFAQDPDGQISLSLSREAAGYGAVLATPNTTDSDPELAAFLAKMKAMQAAGPHPNAEQHLGL